VICLTLSVDNRKAAPTIEGADEQGNRMNDLPHLQPLPAISGILLPSSQGAPEKQESSPRLGLVP